MENMERSKLNSLCQQMGAELSQTLLTTFSDELTTHIPKLLGYFESKELKAIENIVHQLKSNCRYLGFTDYATVCDNVERDIITNKIDNLEDNLIQLIDKQKSLLETVDHTLRELRSAG